MKDILIRGMTEDGFIKVIAVETTGLTEHMRNIHKTLPLATAALGRSLAAASMMGAQIKNDLGSVTVQIHGDGPLGTITAVSDCKGNVRGYLQNPAVDLPLNQLGKLDVRGGVGTEGILTVIKDDGANMPFSGKIELVSGEIAEDIAAYYVQSEQIPTVCALGVLVDTDQSVKAAGGFLLQLMPFAPNSYIDMLEERLGKLKSLTTELLEKGGIEAVINALMEDTGFAVLERQPVAYECKCSKKKVESALLSMGKQELSELLKEEQTKVTCHFCDCVYEFTPEDIEALLKKV